MSGFELMFFLLIKDMDLLRSLSSLAGLFFLLTVYVDNDQLHLIHVHHPSSNFMRLLLN